MLCVICMLCMRRAAAVEGARWAGSERLIKYGGFLHAGEEHSHGDGECYK